MGNKEYICIQTVNQSQHDIKGQTLPRQTKGYQLIFQWMDVVKN